MSLNFKREPNPPRFVSEEEIVLGELGGYGFALFKLRDLSEFFKEAKMQSKKLLSHWNAHRQLFYGAV